MSEPHIIKNVLLVAAMLFGIGLAGLVTRRNWIVVFLAVEMMLQGVSLALVGWSRYHAEWGGQILVLFIVAVAAAEAAVALALVLMLFQHAASLDLVRWQDLREEGQPPWVDRHVPDEYHEERQWPHLVPAGRQPQPDEDELLHRSHV
ncbi:MAG: hypothetical protein KatS3mg110_1047 [Pirellulaceae bacterium]|nr:MAG: hypothetical protein KatS3mg110_1047 [Pirellulaceae bacterium]